MALKDSVALAMRLGAASTAALSNDIDRNIETARKELIRVGVSDIVANSSHVLIEDAIITYCQMQMGTKTLYQQFADAWDYQKDNLRKSTIVISESDGDGSV